MNVDQQTIAPSTVRPSFINIGPGRCATSWLLEALRAHPEIEMSKVKETEYFNTHFDRDSDWYESHFAKDAPAVGEISNNYYLDSAVAARIADYDQSLRLVVNLRNPYTLYESFYNFGIRRGIELPPIEQAQDVSVGLLMGSGYESRLRKDQLTASDNRTLFEAVCLADRIQPFRDAFDSEQIHFFVFEQLGQDWQLALSSLYQFLDVESSFQPENAGQIVNASVQPKSKALARMATATASLLRKVGAYGVLDRLHRSAMIKRVLFNSTKDNTKNEHSELRDKLPSAVTEELDQQISRMKEICPLLETLW